MVYFIITLACHLPIATKGGGREASPQTFFASFHTLALVES